MNNIETTITNSVLSDLCANIITSLVTDVSNNKTVVNTLSGEFVTFKANWTTSETALRNTLINDLSNVSDITNSTLNMGSNDVITTGKVLYSNMYQNEVDLPSATTYHGMFAHVHGTGKAYYAHAGNWVALANESYATELDVNVNTLEENINTIDTTHTNNVNLITQDISNIRLDLSNVRLDLSNVRLDLSNVRLDLSNVVNMTDQISDISDLLHQFNYIAHIDDLSSNINDLSNVLTQTISSVNQNQTSIHDLDTKVNTIKYNTDLSINDIYNDLSANVTSILDAYLTSNPINVDISLTSTDISNVKLIGDISADLYSLYLDVSNINENITDLSLSIATIQSDICCSLLNDISNSITNISTTVVNEAIIDVSASIAGLEATVNLNTSRVLDLITITNDFSSNWTTSEASVRNDLQAYTNTKVETDISNILGSSADTIASLQTLAADIQGDLSFASVITGQINDLSNAIQNVTTTNVDFDCVVKACSSVYVLKTTGVSVGSGCFITFDGTDLSNGYFMTAAHCLLDVFNNSLVYTKKEVYVVDPVTNDWISVPIERIFIDGVADIALIKTNIDFTAHTDCILRFASSLAKTGDTCYLCGNPGGMDEDSLSRGVVRDSHYVLTTSYYFADAIYISAPGIAGNSGSPILNDDGKIIGMFMFGHNGNETFNGGPNLTTLNNSFAVLKTEIDYKDKKYLGFNWTIPTPFSLANHYTYGRFPNKGVIVSSVDTTKSPFKNVLNTNDLLLSITIGTNTIDVGSMIDQRTPGILLYSNETSITIRYIRGTTENIATITLDKTYQDVDNSLDLPLIGAAPTSTLTAKID